MRNYILIFLLCTFEMCKPEDTGNDKLKILNNSDTPITWLLGHNYPDTTLNKLNIWAPRSWENDIIDPGSIGSIPRDDDWNYIFTNKIKSDTLVVFIFNSDTFYNSPWLKIQNEYKVLARYDLSQEDLENLGWKIPYPPAKDLNIKIYYKNK